MNTTIKKMFTNTDKICTITNVISIIWSVVSIFSSGVLLGTYLFDEFEKSFNNDNKMRQLKMKKLAKDNYDKLHDKADDDLKEFLKAAEKDELDIYLLKSTLKRLEREKAMR